MHRKHRNKGHDKWHHQKKVCKNQVEHSYFKKNLSLPKNKSQGERKKKKSTETQRPKKTSEKYQPVAAGSDLDPDSNKLKQISDILKNV